ncbi:hypothetical protein [Thermovibrio ammonificans]|uniref:Uncharacterized protein n=1 Tax=Thermovibrio ammonificans (strain DSM 15698 / JCM 12110 / HB-1) TaxID=648996 RepID=E8T611_THEA1|nr:hypothetical protein [Thermovibrio ammonificans]ADU96595.1 hypothetical protein Theam_0623 [Thermovibrio ammonificans HB-1]
MKLFSRIRVVYTKAFSSQFGPIFSDWPSIVLLFFIFLLLSLITGWIPDGLTALFEGERLKGLFMLGGSCSILLFLLVAAKYLFVNVRFYAVERTPLKRKALILFLSVPGKGGNSRELLDALRKAETIEEKLELVNGSFIRSWRMPFEAMKFHLPELRSVVVISSLESSNYYPLFLKVAKLLFPESQIQFKEIPITSFESFNQVQEAVEKAYSFLKEQGFREKEVILDVTGGKKIVSIVGALLSLQPFREFQYVSTEQGSYSVKSYDLEALKDE